MENEKDYFLSICVPTNGIIEWVFPVLNSIYEQGVDNNLFEVVVTNNGNNDEFNQQMIEYTNSHCNLIYKKTTSQLFDNQLDAIALAHGCYLKFLNHRELLLPGAIERMIDFVKNNKERKPVCYFSNGKLNFSKSKSVQHYSSFDQFVRGLQRYASWTTGVGIWKEDYDRIPKPIVYDKISPHSALLFSERNKNDYIIDDIPFSKEIKQDGTKKGKYDVFKAFGVEEISITFRLLMEGDISIETFKSVRDDYKRYCIELYRYLCIRRKPSSYDISGFNQAMDIFMSRREVLFKAWAGIPFIPIRKIANLIKYKQL